MEDAPRMTTPEPTDSAAFAYDLPPERIAQTPAEPRDSSRLLVLDRATGGLTHRIFRDLPAELRPGDLLVANESRVLPARLRGRKAGGGAAVEVLLLALRPERGPTTWEALVRPGRRLRAGHVVALGADLTAEIGPATPAGGRFVRLLAAGRDDPALVGARLHALGEMPLPPYIHAALADRERYQTVYARDEGSAAAPTAGLHFTPELIARLAAQGIPLVTVSLHVGLDTFRPVEEADLRDHHIHGETIALNAATAAAINATRARGGRIVAVGTTTVRTLESVAARGLPLQPFAGRTELYILPGFPFQVTDAVITNFHLPRSTLLAMISAFAGRERVLAAYQAAMDAGYRFYSFGDAMLIR